MSLVRVQYRPLGKMQVVASPALARGTLCKAFCKVALPGRSFRVDSWIREGHMAEHDLSDSFELRGEFWRPERSDERLSGVLSYSRGTIDLDLVDTLTSGDRVGDWVISLRTGTRGAKWFLRLYPDPASGREVSRGSGKGRTMKKLALFIAVVAALAVTGTAGAVSGGKFVGTPTCTANAFGAVACTARVAGLTDSPTLAMLFFETEWACTADQSITLLAGNVLHFGASVQNGRLFTVDNEAHNPRFYEIIFGVDFGCPGDAWTAVSYTNVRIVLVFSDLSYDVGTVYPS
jgi:hypothetical protein